ncbi:hypothetical protein EC957_001272 [Mortierella hygrophila]|uniref:PH domain-containing protein n=1 Tax=Mortierella hygrophila TaxID=979708 RepID=A0A9P6F527_9FUNG|nr:hypothetical protein EC957_001272 [Mortierella hygrophila]
MPIATLNPFKNSSQSDLHLSNNTHNNASNSNNNSRLDSFNFLKSNNGSSNHLRYNNNNNNSNNNSNSTTPTTPIPTSPSPSPALLYPHRFDTDSNNGNSPYTFNPSPSLTPMTTTDDESSSASFRPRPRQLSKPSTMPSPLGNGYKGNGSSLALSSFSFLSSDKSNSTVPHPHDGNHPYGHTTNSNNNNNNSAHVALSLPPTTQLRVRHLERNSTYAGYLTKFSSRTFFSRKQWKRRYFILSQKSLHCFKSSDPQHPLLESITLCPDTIICVTDMFAGKRFCLQISCPGEKNWYVLADTATEMSGWLRELKGTVQRVRTLQVDSRPPTLYSESSEISDMTSISGLRGVPHVPAIPSQYETLDGHTRSLSGSTRHGPSPSLTSFYSVQGGLDAYHGQAKSLSPPPRPITPKPSTPPSGSIPQHQHQRNQGSLQALSYGQTHGHSPSSDPMPVPEPRRRRNSSLSAGQPATDYASFGSVMARAEALAEVQKESPSSSWSIPAKYEGSSSGSATLPRSKRDSTVSTMSSMSSVNNNHRMSSMADRSEAMASVSHRSSQRLMGSPSRPMSPVSSRPLSPGMTRTSPRSSLVISPPPRSIHRPVSVSIRHSTQILPPPQIITAGLSSQYSAGSPLSSNPPTSSLPATPDSVGSNYQQMYSGSLSRITSLRHQRDLPSSRQSMISLSSNHSGIPTGTGSLQERVQRSSSRTSIMRPSMPSATTGIQLHPKSSTDWVNSSRSLSPTPSLASAPTLPLPQPPRSNSSSPSKEPTPSITSTSSQSSATTSQSQPTDREPSRRASSVPRHHEPDLTIPNRSKARARSASQEAAVLVSKLNEIHLARKVSTPSPRLSAVIAPNQVPSPISPGSGSENNGHRHLRQMSLPLQSMYVLPDPPTREAPAHPTSSTSSSPSRPLKQRSSGSSNALRPLSSVMGQQVPSLGGGVARRSSNAAVSLSGGSNRDSIVKTAGGNGSSGGSQHHQHRHSVQIVPLQTVLPAPPTTALPSKPKEPSEGSNSKKEKRISGAHQASASTTSTGTTGTGFGAILEEEEEEEYEEDDDDDESEFGTSLPFEELEAVKQSTEQDIDQDSTATTPTTSLGVRPEYYATKERTVVEYIFPSEAFPV